MALLHALREQLNAAVGGRPQHALTHRDIRLPKIPNKAHAVIGMRRAGKTCFLRQLQQACRGPVAPERAIFLSALTTIAWPVSMRGSSMSCSRNTTAAIRSFAAASGSGDTSMRSNLCRAGTVLFAA